MSEAFFFFIRFYLFFMRDTQKETDREGGSLQEAWCETGSQDSQDHDLC